MIDLPATLMGWVNLASHAWSILAYAAAAFAGVLALRHAHDEREPAFPLCIITDTTRWLFGRPMSSRNWQARDFISLGVFGAVIGCLFGVYQGVEFISGFDWRKLGYAQGLRQGFVGGITGSSLIILHCGVALHFKRQGLQ